MTDPVDLERVEAGRLLVANPLLPDPNFDRTVVLLLAYSEEGAIGVVLNRPSDTLLAAPLPKWENFAASPAVVFVGGPVQHQAVICLARATRTLDEALGAATLGDSPDGWNAVTSDLGTLNLDLDPSGLAGHFSHVRVFAGYAGWGASQLEGEIEQGAWWVVDADPDDPFSEEPDELWKRVLRRQKGALKLVGAYPDNPMMN